MLNVFVDGSAGTTGLQIIDRLRALSGVGILSLPDAKRKDNNARRAALHTCDAAILCLPDAAAREAVELAEGAKCVIIDASTAHRTEPGWAYGLPELSHEFRQAVVTGNRIAVPGCHATGFAAIVYPLVQAGLIKPSDRLSCTSLTGYSGGGKTMIAEFEGEQTPQTRGALPYALTLKHKHLPEMTAVCGLDYPPIFMPVIAPVRQGMIVTVPLALDATLVHNTLKNHYRRTTFRIAPVGDIPDCGRLTMEACNGLDTLEMFIFGDETQTLCATRFDNLGKGASGAAVECLKLRFGLN